MNKLVIGTVLVLALGVTLWQGHRQSQAIEVCRDIVWATQDVKAERGLTYEQAAALGKQTNTELNKCNEL